MMSEQERVMRKYLPTFGGHPVPELFTLEEVALAEQLARELFATATVPIPDGDMPLLTGTEKSE